MRADIILTLPCPLCVALLTAVWEPQERPGTDLPLLVSVSGCPHAELAMREYDGAPGQVGVAFWRAVHHEIEKYALDRYTDALEQSAKYRRLRDEP